MMAIPVLCRLYRSKKTTPPDKYRKRSELAAEMLELLRRWLPSNRRLVLLGDDEYACNVVATRIAAHAADIAKGLPGAMDWDNQMSAARKNLDWPSMLELALDPDKARAYRESSQPLDEEVCTMCGDLCAVKRSRRVLEEESLDLCVTQDAVTGAIAHAVGPKPTDPDGCPVGSFAFAPKAAVLGVAGSTGGEVQLWDDPIAQNPNIETGAPATDENRALDENGEWLVMIGVCT